MEQYIQKAEENNKQEKEVYVIRRLQGLLERIQRTEESLKSQSATIEKIKTMKLDEAYDYFKNPERSEQVLYTTGNAVVTCDSSVFR